MKWILGFWHLEPHHSSYGEAHFWFSSFKIRYSTFITLALESDLMEMRNVWRVERDRQTTRNTLPFTRRLTFQAHSGNKLTHGLFKIQFSLISVLRLDTQPAVYDAPLWLEKAVIHSHTLLSSHWSSRQYFTPRTELYDWTNLDSVQHTMPWR